MIQFLVIFAVSSTWITIIQRKPSHAAPVARMKSELKRLFWLICLLLLWGQEEWKWMAVLKSTLWNSLKTVRIGSNLITTAIDAKYLGQRDVEMLLHQHRWTDSRRCRMLLSEMIVTQRSARKVIFVRWLCTVQSWPSLTERNMDAIRRCFIAYMQWTCISDATSSRSIDTHQVPDADKRNGERGAAKVTGGPHPCSCSSGCCSSMQARECARAPQIVTSKVSNLIGVNLCYCRGRSRTFISYLPQWALYIV